MPISSISAAIQSYILGFEKSFQQKPKSSGTTYPTTQASAATSQQSTLVASASPAVAPSQESTDTAGANRYSSGVAGIAALLSSKGATVSDPNLVQFINPIDTPAGPRAVTGDASGPPATPSYVASQIIEGVGSDGVLTLAEVEKAENGTTGAPTSNSNSDSDIAADFEKLSGGSTTMTAAQLTKALQSYIASQSLAPE
jgi:hypothetical protein